MQTTEALVKESDGKAPLKLKHA